MPTPTEQNPAGVQPFDHTAIASLPEYKALSRALEDLVEAMRRADTRAGGQEWWLRAVRDMACALPFSDSCTNCDEAPAPFRAEIDHNGWLTGHYLCANCGRTWTCGWSLEAPNLV